jgi:hypothetical protein
MQEQERLAGSDTLVIELHGRKPIDTERATA